MAPQEKAEKLVYKMYDEMFYYKDGYSSSDAIGAAKKCALIAVDEILDELLEIVTVTSSKYISKHINYYQEVKQELTKQQEQ
jgi:hypothetical protein